MNVQWRLDQVSQRFRRAFLYGRTNGVPPRHPDDEKEMEEASTRGVQILRALSLAVRSEQDFGLVPTSFDIVGAFKRKNAELKDANEVKHRFGHRNVLKLDGYGPLKLRQALNKIAHADPESAGFFVGPSDRTHELLLFGDERGNHWFAAISIPCIVDAIRSLPDTKITELAA